MMDWAYFKEGTYWVYQDTAATHRIDSNYVVQDTLYRDKKYDKGENNVILDREIIEMTFYSTFNNTAYVYKTRGGGCIVDGENRFQNSQKNPCNYLSKEFATPKGESVHIFIFWMPPRVGLKGDSRSTLTDYYDTYEVQGKVYKDVVRMNTVNNDVERGKTVYFYAKHYGVIRKKVKIKQDEDDPGKWRVWDLVRSNIVQ